MVQKFKITNTKPVESIIKYIERTAELHKTYKDKYENRLAKIKSLEEQCAKQVEEVEEELHWKLVKYQRKIFNIKKELRKKLTQQNKILKKDKITYLKVEELLEDAKKKAKYIIPEDQVEQYVDMVDAKTKGKKGDITDVGDLCWPKLKPYSKKIFNLMKYTGFVAGYMSIKKEFPELERIEINEIIRKIKRNMIINPVVNEYRRNCFKYVGTRKKKNGKELRGSPDIELENGRDPSSKETPSEDGGVRDTGTVPNQSEGPKTTKNSSEGGSGNPRAQS